ncbi:aldehyde dehydrogenase family protein [Nocardia gipuzkoensis]|uniref:aldehyde dehydrogenase family protein n=1 Tax=Nocardia gipuzkoensis TaxID=2749991 RepID=UPI001E64CE5B|nr:aldehyde dehydrogenase family protein [Nocardia gipuzkoensis]UGT67759.1 aldehyde dehydrogenase family protein [Nocardia gipuzkoensis]
MTVRPFTNIPTEPSSVFQSLDPRTGELIEEFPVHDARAVEEAVAEARNAAEWWSGLGFRGREKRLKQWRRLILERFDELAGVISNETGKPIADARIEVVLGVAHLHWAAKNAKRVLGRRHVAPGMLMSNHLASVEYLPLGVVGVIGPWNYPVFTPMGSIAYALAAGNAVVFKPSEYTPAVGQWLASTFSEALGDEAQLRSPFQTVTGTGETGAALCRAGVDKVAFTGSNRTGKAVMRACADSLTPVLMECGGKDALLVDLDANLAAAADAAVWGSLANAGQTCVGVERVYVVEQVAERFIELVSTQAATLQVGGELDSDLGPITLPSQIEVIRSHIDNAISRGGRAILGGRDSVRAPFVEPVVLVDVPEDSIAVTEETFGPLVIINRVRSMQEAVVRANANEYRLGATVFSRRGAKVARELNVGMVGVNSVLPYVAMPSLPFGGVGSAGFGRIHGADGLREFTRAKSVARKILPATLRPTSFSRPKWTVQALAALTKVLYRW